MPSDDNNMDNVVTDQEFISQFIDEGRELLETMEDRLLACQQGDVNEAIIDDCFRAMHSLKGNCGFMGFEDLEAICHSAESVLFDTKSGTVAMDERVITTLLNVIDVARRFFVGLEAQSDAGIANKGIILELLQELNQSGNGTNPVDPQTGTLEFDGSVLIVAHGDLAVMTAEALNAAGYTTQQAPTPPAALELLESSAVGGVVELCICDVSIEGPTLVATLNKRYPQLPIVALSDGNDSADLQQLLNLDVAACVSLPLDANALCESVANVLRQQIKRQFMAGVVQTTEQQQRHEIRVGLDKLDHLINLVGELMIAESMLIRCPELASQKLPAFERAAHRVELLTNELQDLSMAIRMVPVSGTFRKMARVIHDLSARSGKPIRLETSGDSTEIDTGVLDLLTDPLIHLIRNCADHGIEAPAVRVAKDKPAEGTITLTASQLANEVCLTIEDDGGGINRDRILDKAHEKGLVTPAQTSKWTDEQVFDLIFQPGFSTAQSVTDVSGRGVGMDVVKQNVERAKGRIEIVSKPDIGTTFRIRIPLTLATIEGMLVRIGVAKYTVPISAIRESFRPEHSDITTRADGQQFVRIRDRLIPIIQLAQLHHLKPDAASISDGILIVLDVDGKDICLPVDEIMYQLQTIIKDISRYLGTLTAVAGCNILGDGEISLILNPQGLLSAQSSVSGGTIARCA